MGKGTQRIGFFGTELCKLYFLCFKMMCIIVLLFLVKIPCPGKFWFLRYLVKYSQPIKLLNYIHELLYLINCSLVLSKLLYDVQYQQRLKVDGVDCFNSCLACPKWMIESSSDPKQHFQNIFTQICSICLFLFLMNTEIHIKHVLDMYSSVFSLIQVCRKLIKNSNTVLLCLLLEFICKWQLF